MHCICFGHWNQNESTKCFETLHTHSQTAKVHWPLRAGHFKVMGCIRTKILGNQNFLETKILLLCSGNPLHNLKVMRGAFGQKLSGPKFFCNNSWQSNSSQISGSYIREGAFKESSRDQNSSAITADSQTNSSQISGSYIRVGAFRESSRDQNSSAITADSQTLVKYPGATSGWVHSSKSSQKSKFIGNSLALRLQSNIRVPGGCIRANPLSGPRHIRNSFHFENIIIMKIGNYENIINNLSIKKMGTFEKALSGTNYICSLWCKARLRKWCIRAKALGINLSIIFMKTLRINYHQIIEIRK